MAAGVVLPKIDTKKNRRAAFKIPAPKTSRLPRREEWPGKTQKREKNQISHFKIASLQINLHTMKKFILSLAVFVLLLSCGGKKTQESAHTEHTETPVTKQKTSKPNSEPASQQTPEEEPPAEQTASNAVELTIEGNDQMQFNETELKVKAGQKVTLTLKHTGNMPKNVMGHNWVLLKSGVDFAEFSTQAMKAKDTDYIPDEADIIAHTTLVGGGESTSVTFDAPEKGTYDFLCSFPAHSALMRGKFIVE